MRLSFLIFSILFIVAACQGTKENKEGDLYEQADKGFTTSDLDSDLDEMVPVDFTITVSDMNFNPNQVEATAGELIRIILKNEGDEPHNVAFELPSGEVKFTNNVETGQTDSMEFTVPVQVGTYPMYCPVENHREQGMTGELTVTAPEAN